MSFVKKYVTHSRRVIDIASQKGWLPGANYNNLRDVKHVDRVGFIDIDWKNYDFHRHLDAVAQVRPQLTVARDIEDQGDLDTILQQAETLAMHCQTVVIVPKDIRLGETLDTAIPSRYVLGYSVPTRYGGTCIPPDRFQRPVHLLGGRPDVQRALAEKMPVVSIDCNRFTLDASFGDYFDGETFRPHPVGGYVRCLEESLDNINAIWREYEPNLNGHDPS